MQKLAFILVASLFVAKAPRAEETTEKIAFDCNDFTGKKVLGFALELEKAFFRDEGVKFSSVVVPAGSPSLRKKNASEFYSGFNPKVPTVTTALFPQFEVAAAVVVHTESHKNFPEKFSLDIVSKTDAGRDAVVHVDWLFSTYWDDVTPDGKYARTPRQFKSAQMLPTHVKIAQGDSFATFEMLTKNEAGQVTAHKRATMLCRSSDLNALLFPH